MLYTEGNITKHLPVELVDVWFYASDYTEPSDAYAVLLYYLTRQQKPDGDDLIRMRKSISSAYDLIDSLPKWDVTYYDVVNSMLHILHQGEDNYNAREEGIETLSRALGIEDLTLYIKSEKYQGKLSAKGEFPEDLKDQIEEVIKPWRDDLQVEYLITWYHCHLDDGDNYVTGTESPYIEMRSVSEDSLRFAREALMRAGLIYGD